MSLLFDAMKALFIRVLFVRYEARILGCPGWMRNPFIVEDGIAKLIASTTLLVPFPLRDVPIALTKRFALVQVDTTSDWRACFIFDNLISTVVVEENLEVREQFRVGTDEVLRAVH